MRYDELEDIIVQQLAPLSQAPYNCYIQSFPETEAAFTRPLQNGDITVCYRGSKGEPERSTGNTFQKERVQFEIVIRHMKLKGEAGIHAIADIIKRRLLGFRVDQLDPMYLVAVAFHERNKEQAIWAYTMVFEAMDHLLEDYDENGIAPLSQVTLQDNYGEQVVYPIDHPVAP